ncbi:hypothetical protein Hanom_Chr13g01189271 [Helianthus anomalus]
MYLYNRGFIPPPSSGDLNRMNTPNQPVDPVPTQSTAYETGFVEYNHHQTGFITFLNQPLSWTLMAKSIRLESKLQHGRLRLLRGIDYLRETLSFTQSRTTN